MATIVPVAPGAGDPLGAGGAPDAGLVNGLRAGSRDAFEQLYELYRARIYNLALRIVRSPEDARDITQDVFVKVFRRFPGSRVNEMQLKPWLYRVAVNACYDHLRTRKVHRDIDVMSDTRAMPVDTFEQAEMSQLVEQTLGGLSERHRTVLVLKDIHGLRHDEIAGILGISRGATETLLFRARESFRSQYVDLTTEHPAPSCTFARDAAVTAVGGELRGDERRRIMAHAAHCPACRDTVKTWSATAVGLGLFLHGVPVPAALQGAFPFGAAGTAAGGAGAGGAAGAGAGGGTAAGAGAGASGGSALAGTAGVAASGASMTAGSTAGLSVVTGGLLTKLGGAATVKVAALIVAASCAAGGGVAAYEADTLPGIHPHHSAPAAAGKAHDRAASAKNGQSDWTPPGLAKAAANGGQGAARSAAARAKAKGKSAAAKGKSAAAKGKSAAAKQKGGGKGKSNAQHGSAGANGHGNAGAATNAGGNGKSGGSTKVSKPAKPTKPVKPTKPAKPPKPPKPPKPEKPVTPDKTTAAS